jgi:hypothetical protein
MKFIIEMGPGTEKVIAELGAMGDKVIGAVSEGLAEGVKLAATKVIDEHITGQDLKTRSGDLRRAVDGWLEAPLDGVIGVRSGSAVEKYKWLLGTEQKTITAKKKFLAIPMPYAQTSSGVTKEKYLPPSGTSLKDFIPDSFIFKGKSGGLFIGVKTGKTDRSIKALFVLKKYVTVTGSGALLAGVLDSVDGITERINEKIEKKI